MNYSEYFTKELQENINDMSDDEMNQMLIELESTRYWIAILKYSQKRMSIVQSSLASVDPIAKATEMCRSQGILAGQSDLQSMVISLVSRNKKVEDDNKK